MGSNLALEAATLVMEISTRHHEIFLLSSWGVVQILSSLKAVNVLQLLRRA